MDMLFNDMMSNLGSGEERTVARYERDTGDLTISTMENRGDNYAFETAISHSLYKDSNWIVVELYDTREDAQTGHDKWLAAMNSDDLPGELVDVIYALVEPDTPDVWTYKQDQS